MFTIRYLNSFSILAVVIAFAMGAGIGSGFGYKTGSSRVEVFSQGSNSPLQLEEPAKSITGYAGSDDEQYLILSTLQERIESLELRLDSLQLQVTDVSQALSNVPTGTALPAGDQTQDLLRGELRTQLQSAGFTDSEYEVISATRNQLRLKRLQLRDKAIREGWFRTDSWSMQVRELDPDTALRRTLGDQRFDDYLVASGRNNRVRVDELMTGSAAELAGLLAGDLIHRYADARVFNSYELRRLTSDGLAGENTALTVLRDGELIDLVVPRGPLGVIISGTRAQGRSDQ